MKRLIAPLAVVLAMAGLAASAQADPSEYGIKTAFASTSTSQAGAHPDFILELELKTENEEGNTLPATTRDTEFALSPGLLANPNAVPKCTSAQLAAIDVEDKTNAGGCPQAAQIGVTEVVIQKNGVTVPVVQPVFNMRPRHGEPAGLGFFADIYPISIGVGLRSEGDYGATASVHGVSTFAPLLYAKTRIWGVPADESHDTERFTPYEGIHSFGAPETPTGKRTSELVPVPYMVNPTRCGVERNVTMTVASYLFPDLPATAIAPLGPGTGCGQLDFEPAMTVAPTTTQAETGAGLDVELSFPSEGLEHPNVLSGPHLKRAEVILPEGVTVNPSQAEGLGVCSAADYARETAASGPNEGCPETAKIGNVSAKSPLLDEVAEGSLYIAKPKENPFGALIALYMVLKIPERGVVVKLAGKVEPDPVTGQLVTSFDDIPQLPVESFHLHFREGARSPLVTPPRCGTYTSTARFIPWSATDPFNPQAAEIVTTHPTFAISSGVDGGACPGGTSPFLPGFKAYPLNNNAGAFSPFYMRLTRRDGDQDLTKFSATLPPGMVAKLAGLSRCSDAALEAAKARAGKDELASPSCPASSEIGNVLAGAGVGSVLTYAKGKIYLAGPYRGAPLSVAAIVPAVAGPFDVGTVVTRQALQLNPRTGVVTADGEHSDPIPHILAGIPLKVRDVRVYVDRPSFTLNPTSCDPLQTTAQLWGGGNDVFSAADDSPVTLAERFQAANCSLLGFKPELSLTLRGGSKRGDHPALRGIFKPRAGDANLSGLVVRFPHSAFLDQAHIRTICTRVQFAAKTCPAGAIYGHVKATTPLLDEPLEGPIYLRSSSNKLPDVVADLRGIVDVEAVARIDSVDGGIRATFTEVPDAPLSKVVVQMQGGKKGLIVNSTNLCQGSHRAKADLSAHNGKRLTLRPPMRTSSCTKKQDRKH